MAISPPTTLPFRALTDGLGETMVLAARGRRLGEATEGEMAPMWNRLINLLGLKVSVEPGAAAWHKQEFALLTGYVREDYPLMTVEEVVLAYRLAVRGLLADPFRAGQPLQVFAELNPRSLGVVMTAYAQRREREMLLQAQKGAVAKRTVLELPPDPMEQERGMRALLARAWAVVGEGGEYQDWGNLLYEWLDKTHGLIPFTAARRHQFMAEAQGVLQAEVRRQGEADPLRRAHTQSLLQAIKAASEAGAIHQASEGRIIQIAKQRALGVLLREWHEAGVGPQEMLPPLEEPQPEREEEV